MEEFKFHVEDGRLVNGTYPIGVDELCAIVDVTGSLMKYGEMDRVKNYYMKIQSMYTKMKSDEFIEQMNYFGVSSDIKNKEILFIEFNKLDLPLEYKAKLMNYMIEVSLNGAKIKELLEGSKEDLIKYLDYLEE